jgi:hypothetical protein
MFDVAKSKTKTQVRLLEVLGWKLVVKLIWKWCPVFYVLL